MTGKSKQTRVNIYLDNADLKRAIKVAAANRGMTVSGFCVEAIREKLEGAGREEEAMARESKRQAAGALDQLRLEIGRIGIPVRELIEEGRRR